MVDSRPILISAAIDFGTTYSGLAYSYSSERDVAHVQCQWPGGGIQNKVPTVVLFDRDTKFIAFGDDAIERYCDLCEDGEQDEFYFFKYFKMALYDSKDIRKNMMLTEENGKQMDAMDVFSAVIRFMKDHLIQSVCKRGEIVHLNVACVRWVVTVPAIWSHSAKVFMRKASEKAGLPSDNLVIALEPESASIYCNTAPKERMSLTADYNKSNAKYLIVDNGGGTIDITAHQILENGNIKEMYKANGGPWGGKKVDEMFEEFLKKLFSTESIEEIKKYHQMQWTKLFQEFQAQKSKINENDTSMISLSSLPWNSQHFKNLSPKAKEGIELKASRLRIKTTIIEKMIRDVSKHITSHVTDLLKEESLKDVDVIMMVGGFSNSPILVDEMKKCVAYHQIPIVVPEEAQLAVLKGAVLFGWNQEKIMCRRSKYTYFYKTSILFNENKHPERLTYIATRNKNKEKYCQVLDKLVTVDEELNVSHVVTRTRYPIHDYQKEMSFYLYASNKENALYHDDVDVEEIGELRIPLAGVKNALDRQVDVLFYFGLTELKVKTKDKVTGETHEGIFHLTG